MRAHRSTSLPSAPSTTVALVVLAIATGICYAPAIFGDRIFPNGDLLTHYRWIVQFAAALAEGTWYPRWMPLMDSGLGELFYSAYPLFYYAVALLTLAGLSVWQAIKTLAIASAFLSGAVAFFGLRRTAGSQVALIAGVLVVSAPLPLFLFTHHQSLPWQFALPLAVAVLVQSIDPYRERRGIALALTVAALVLAHALVAYKTLLCVGVALAAEALVRGRRAMFALTRFWILPVLIGLGLAAFNLVPAVASGSLRTPFLPDDHVFVQWLNWRNSFAFPTWTSERFGTRWFAMQWPLPAVALGYVIASALLLARTRANRNARWWSAARLWAVAMVALLFSSELAYPLYEAFPPLRNVQWPYRFVSVAALAAALSLALAAEGLLARARTGSAGRWALLALLGAVGASAAVSIGLVTQVALRGSTPSLSPALLEGDFAQYGAEFRTRGPLAKDYARGGGFPGECRRIDAACEELLAQNQRRAWAIELLEERRVRLPMYYFPGWTTWIDGEEVMHSLDAETGLVAVAVPRGSHTIEIRLTGFRPWAAIGGSITVLSVFALAAGLIARRRRDRSSGGLPQPAS